jgi:BASS family bile acid:Na+ symporter
MKDLILEILKIVAPLSVAFVVFSQGLGTAPGRVAAYLRDQPGVLVRAMLASLVLVPLAALALILLFKPSPALAIGLAIIVACPPAPLMLKAATKKGGGNREFMASLHLSLALLAFVTVPAILFLLSLPLGFSVGVDFGAMAWILARTILIPVGLGLAIRAAKPELADRIAPIVGKVGTVGLLVVVVFALAALYPMLLKTDALSYLLIALVSVSALAIGHLLGPADASEKTIVAVESAVRHPVLAITIAASNFGKQEALPVMVPCVLTFIVIAFVYMSWRGRAMKLQSGGG